jgi:hypothetical protein
MPFATESYVESLCREFEHLAGDRGVWESHWQEIAERVIPSHSGQFNAHNLVTPGEKRTTQLYDSTAAIALNRFGAILDSLLTPRNQTWHRLKPSDPKLLKDRQTRLWFEEVTRLLFQQYRYDAKANFASQNQQNYKSLGAFGTGCMFIDAQAGGSGLRYKGLHLGGIFFAENHQGIVDTAYRKFKLTARQAAQKWGQDKLPDPIKSKLGAVGGNKEQLFEFLHCVKPRQDYDSRRIDAMGMPFASTYVSITGKALMSEGGFNTFPYAISRYETAPDEIYGRSPAMDVLPAIKTLNEEKKTILKQGHRVVDPVLLAHDDGVLDSFSLRPGDINYGGVSADGKPLVHTLPTGRIDIGKDLMDDERLVINDAFLVTIFQILVETPQMTATEVLERTREKGILLAPTLGRQQSEYLGPLIEREVDLLAQQRLLPPMPQGLIEARGEYSITYDSPLSRAQRAEEAAGLMRTIEATLNVVNVTQNPEPLDHFEWDTAIPELADINGVPVRWMKSLEQVTAIREQRAQAAQAQMAIQAAPGAAAMMKAGAVVAKGA